MDINYKQMQNLFLQQSYEDSWEDYQRSIKNSNFPQWDYVILSASNEEQAATYQSQMDLRKQQGLLSKHTKYIALSDPDGERVGSGGATLNVLRYINDKENGESPFFKKILLIHSGGDSKRVPQYSARGKLFAPVPRELPNGKTSTLFDEFMISMSGLPGRMENGMLVIGGDVLLLFNPLQLDLQHQGATAISFPADIEIGKDHGVFLNDGNDFVARFLHKESPDVLRKYGAVDENDKVNLDIGALILDYKVMDALFSLITTNGKYDDLKFKQFVNPSVCLSFYGDFLFPLASESTFEEYEKQDCETVHSNELSICRKAIWNVLNVFSLRLLCLFPSEYIHLGTTKELLELLIDQLDDYSFLGWRKQVQSNRAIAGNIALHNAYIDKDVVISNGAYLENCYVLENSQVGEGSILSNVVIKNETVPPKTVLHGIKLRDEGFLIRVYGVYDNVKAVLDATFLQTPLSDFIKFNDLCESDLWDSDTHDLWTAKLYPVSDDIKEAFECCEILFKMVKGTASKEELNRWKTTKRLSLHTSFNLADIAWINTWEESLRSQILSSKFILAMEEGVYYKDALLLFGHNGITSEIYKELLRLVQNSSVSVKIRVYYSIAEYMKENNKIISEITYDQVEDFCYKEIKDLVCTNYIPLIEDVKNFKIKQSKNPVTIQLPVRINWGGGWTDTAPYCIEKGGVLLNAAISLNGTLPIIVKVSRLETFNIILESFDGKIRKEITNYNEMLDCTNPFDPFALHKAAFLVTGIIKNDNDLSLEQYLKNLGGGICLQTHVKDVPRGSGLGTSSILAGGCVKALYQLFNIIAEESNLYKAVFVMEQMMTTGGGWQDQVGGLANGIKFTSSKPSYEQDLSIQQVQLSEETKKELNERFVLVYTGQRRLARNLLRFVVGNYIGNNEQAIEILDKMKPLTALMKFYLEQGNITLFGNLLSEQWELCKLLDNGCTNTCIDQISLSCKDLIDGIFIAGAGGGGFLQMILKKDVSKNQLQERLLQVFQKSGIDLLECEILF